MERLYQIIERHFSRSEIEGLATDLSIYVPPNSDPAVMAQELFLGARRNLRLDVLFDEVHRRKAALRLDLRPNLYELIAGTFTEQEAVELVKRLGLQHWNPELSAAGLAGWSSSDDHFRTEKARILQETAEQHGIYGALLTEMNHIRPPLNLAVFQQTATHTNENVARFGKSRIDLPNRLTEEQKGMGDTIYGDKVGGDKIGGDKVGGDKISGHKNVYKGTTVSGVSGGSALSIGGDAVVGPQVKDIQGDVTIGGEGKRPDRDTLLALLVLLQQDVAAIQSELGQRDAQEAAETLQAVQEEIQKETPTSGWVIRKLKNVAEIAAAAGVATAAANQLGAHIQQAVQIAQSLFGR